MALPKSQTLKIQSTDEIVYIRRLARDYAVEYGFNLVDQTKLVTAASELARNMVLYAGGGDVTFEVLDSVNPGRIGLKMIFKDTGPGIADIQLALKDGYTTSGGLGLGLSGAKRLVNEFDIQSTPGLGTTVTIVRWR